MSVGLLLGQRYRLIEELGRGGMGSVWRAEDLELDAPAAVKLIDPALVESSEALTRFKREAKAAASIRSTHVVQILGYGVDNGVPYIAMELLKGESLANRLQREGKLSPEHTLKILTHVGRALALAHENGIVHRDLKPDNIFLVREMDECIAKVLDFGVARQRGGMGDTGGLKTKTGAVLGTPYYMSPEQATGKNVDHLTDIWSFGVIASECLTGARPFEGESIGGLFSAICIEPLPLPSQLGAVPAGFDEWFAQAVARDRSARFQSIQQASAGLEQVCAGRGMQHLASSSAAQQGTRAPSFAGTASAGSARSSESKLSAGMETTSAPSAHSVALVPRQRRGITPVVIASVAALLLAGLFAGWRLMRTSDATIAPASVAVSAPTTPLPSQVVLQQPSPAASADPHAAQTASAAVAVATAAPVLAPAAVSKAPMPAIRPIKSANAVTRTHPKLDTTPQQANPPAAAVAAPKPAPAAPADRLGI